MGSELPWPRIARHELGHLGFMVFCWVILGEGHGCIIWVYFFFSWWGGEGVS